MKSAYYTFTTWEDCEQAAGFGGGLEAGRQAAIVRRPAQKARPLGGDNVIDLAAWRCANRELWEEPEPEQASAPEELGPEPEPAAVRRVRRDHSTARAYSELASILGVLGVLAALMLRVLMF